MNRGATVAMALCLSLIAAVVSADEYDTRRQEMVRAIAADVRETALYIDKHALDERVMQVMARVPRHRFVPKRERRHAYQNRPLPIGHGQTISQPYIVALMTDMLELDEESRVLEVGTGSGYQAAVAAELAASVHSIEIIPELARQARKLLASLEYSNVFVTEGDGYYGLEDAAPFDAIIVTAAADHVPPPLIEQLKPGGRMVIPVGGRFQVQQLLLIEKRNDATVSTRQILPVRFVPLTGRH